MATPHILNRFGVGETPKLFTIHYLNIGGLMTIIDAIIQGIVQGLTEFLPVSSSGHLSLIQYFTGNSGETGAFFSILVHAGTLFAVIIAFWRTILELIVEGLFMLWDIVRFKFDFRYISAKQKMIFMLILSLVPLFAVLFLKDTFEALSTDNNIITEGICFLITSQLLFMAHNNSGGRKRADNMTSTDALLIGTIQAVAPLPGVSRSGSTVAVGLMRGLSKEFAVEFSFIMGIPAVLGAVILEVYDIVSGGMVADVSTSVMAAGFITSLIFGVIAIKAVKWLVTNNKFKLFAIYTGVLGVVTLIIGAVDLFFGFPVQEFVMGLL